MDPSRELRTRLAAAEDRIAGLSSMIADHPPMLAGIVTRTTEAALTAPCYVSVTPIDEDSRGAEVEGGTTGPVAGPGPPVAVAFFDRVPGDGEYVLASYQTPLGRWIARPRPAPAGVPGACCGASGGVPSSLTLTVIDNFPEGYYGPPHGEYIPYPDAGLTYQDSPYPGVRGAWYSGNLRGQSFPGYTTGNEDYDHYYMLVCAPTSASGGKFDLFEVGAVPWDGVAPTTLVYEWTFSATSNNHCSPFLLYQGNYDPAQDPEGVYGAYTRITVS